MLLRGHFQNAYVTRDLDRAMALVGERLALGEWIAFPIELEVSTPQGAQTMGTKVGLAWSGHLQIELIEPVSGWLGPYLDFLPADRDDATPRLHHISLRRETKAEVEGDIARIGLPRVCEGGVPDLQFWYVDGRATLGHYLEFVCATEAGWQMLGWPNDRIVS